jgi:hypothetical protein
MATAASRRFSSSRRLARAISRRSRLLGAFAFVLAAAVAATAVATNGFRFGHRPSQRAQVSTYIREVDRVEQQMNFPITRVMAAYRSYAQGSGSPSTVAKLKRAERTLDTLSARIRAVPAPAQAHRLRKALTSLLSAEYAVAHEVRQLAQFTPQFHAVTLQTQLLSAELSKALASVTQPKSHLVRGTPKQIAQARAAYAAAVAQAASAQAKVIDAYDAQLSLLVARLKRIVYPPVMGPTYAAELATLRRTRSAGAALAAGLRAPNHSNVAVLSRRFSEAARTAGALFRQRQAIAAVQAYNARVKRISNLQLAVQNEFVRLSNTVK